MSRRETFPKSFPALFAATVGVGLYFLSVVDILGDRAVFVALTILLLIFLAMEVAEVRRVHSDRWLLNPAVFGSVMTFVLAYGVSNLLFFVPADQLELLGLVPDVTPAMTKLMWLVLIGAIAMWVGYWSSFASYVSRPAVVARFQFRFLPGAKKPRPLAVLMIVAVATGARLLQVNLGVFGYSSSYERLVELGGITQYLSFGAALGKLALVLVACQYFSGRQGRGVAPWFYGILCLELMWGILSGFKSAVVLPFVIVVLCRYLRLGRFGKGWIVACVVGLMAAYAIVEPFRYVRNEDASYRGTSVASIAAGMLGADSGVGVREDSPPFLLALASRSNLSFIGSFGVEYADAGLVGDKGDPEFLADILFAPAHAWIPRFIWRSKPLGNLGLWYNQVVMGMTHVSSTAMGPVTYLYFAGGGAMVFAGFLVIGAIQRFLFALLQPMKSLSGAVVFLAVLPTISVIDSSVNGVIISLLRDFPLVVALQFLLFRAESGSKALRVALT